MRLIDLHRAKTLDDERKTLENSLSRVEMACDRGHYVDPRQFVMRLLHNDKPHDKPLIAAVLEWLRAEKAACEESLRQLGVEVE